MKSGSPPAPTRQPPARIAPRLFNSKPAWQCTVDSSRRKPCALNAIGWRTNVTTLSSTIGTIGTDTDNSYHVVTTSGTDSTALLDGLTITKSYNSTGGSPTLANLIITGNYVWSHGAGMYTSNGNPTLMNITFYSDTVPNGDGGGLSNFGGAPTLTDVTFDSNVGGGMAIASSNATLVNVTFYNNRHFGGGGGLRVTNNSTPTLTVDECNFLQQHHDRNCGRRDLYQQCQPNNSSRDDLQQLGDWGRQEWWSNLCER